MTINWLKRLLGLQDQDIFDLERVDVPPAAKEDRLMWLARAMGYFKGDIREIRKFYIIFTLESGQNYRVNDPALIEKNIDLDGGCIKIVFPLVKATKECRVVEFRVYDKDDNFLVLRAMGTGYCPTDMKPSDSISFSYRITT
jgi:hypothetical protein